MAQDVEGCLEAERGLSDSKLERTIDKYEGQNDVDECEDLVVNFNLSFKTQNLTQADLDRRKWLYKIREAAGARLIT